MTTSAELRPGRPRSQTARRAVLEAVDDLLVEVGYAAMTMKSIAERAGVGRPTVYRWWATKAEILLEACQQDAAEDLPTAPGTEPPGDPAADLTAYLRRLTDFLTRSPAGLAYRALLGETQHDEAVAALMRTADVLGRPSRQVLDRHRPTLPGLPHSPLAVAQLTGPVIAAVLLTGVRLSAADLARHVDVLLAGWSRP